MPLLRPARRARIRAVAAPLRTAYRRTRSTVGRMQGVPRSECPICGFRGAFVPGGGRLSRPQASCPGCGAAERHRLVRAACDLVLDDRVGTTLHLAPESHLTATFRDRSEAYVTADISPGHDLRLDLTAIGLGDDTCDLIVAIHILEHIRDDDAALAELARVLRRGGTAVIAVPVVADRTVEYSRPNPGEHLHVRAPGVDWYERLRDHFGDVRLVSSADVPDRFQTRVHEDRTGFPNRVAPERPAMTGAAHLDYVAFAR